jgi:hypothetical protein
VVATDVRDERLLARLESVATALAPSYRQRFGLEAEPAGTVLLFGREKGFRGWLAARSATEGGPADSGLEGFATSGTAALHAAQRSTDEVAGLLVHELTHLLTQSATERQLPPWLEEGLAEELAMSRLDREGAVIAGSLRMERTVRADGPSRVERTVSGPGAALVRLVGTPGALVPLDALLAFDAESFFQPAGRTDRYATAGFLVRFLLAEEPRAARFRSFLAEAAAGAAADGPALQAALGEPLPALEAELMGWLRRTALAGGG